MNSWNIEQLNHPWANTGPLIFTRQVWDFIKRHPLRSCVYPIKFFHPLPNTYRFDYWEKRLPRSFIESFFIEETFAVHYWAESWVEKKIVEVRQANLHAMCMLTLNQPFATENILVDVVNVKGAFNQRL